jgi:trans-aconitate methyltransferase
MMIRQPPEAAFCYTTTTMEKNFTEDTYDKAAQGYTQKFKDIGVRSADVDQTFSFVNTENPHVVEIGCGAGREAEYILTKTDSYIGIDISAGMLTYAKEKLPEAHFEKVAVEEYQFPKNTDVVFAFASLLHTSKVDLQTIFLRMYDALPSGGVIFVSLKRRNEYTTAVVEDTYGPREFHYYSRNDLLEVAGSGFEEVFYEEQERLEDWFTMILKKK